MARWESILAFIRSGRQKFFGSDVIEWASRFGVDNYQTRFLCNQFDGAIGTAELRCAGFQIQSMQLAGYYENLPGYLEKLGAELTGVPFSLNSHSNKSDRNIISLSNDERAYLNEILRAAFCLIYASSLPISENEGVAS